MIETDLNLYGLMLTLAYTSNIIFISIFSFKKKYSVFEIWLLIIFEGIGIILGGKLFTYLTNFSSNKIFDFFNLSLSSLGSVIGLLIMIFLFKFLLKKETKEVLNICLPSIPLMYSIGKMGCFLVGCCFGIEYQGIGNIVYNYSQIAPIGINLFPIQLIESISFFIIFIYIFTRSIKNEYNYKQMGIIILVCATTKFILDFFRMSHVGKILSINQILCLIFVFIGIGILYINKKKNIIL